MKLGFTIFGVFVLFAMALMIGCNRQIIDLNLKFKTAYCKWPDGTMKAIKIYRWRDYENSDQIQIIDEKGTVYLLHSVNVVLVNE